MLIEERSFLPRRFVSLSLCLPLCMHRRRWVAAEPAFPSFSPSPSLVVSGKDLRKVRKITFVFVVVHFV